MSAGISNVSWFVDARKLFDTFLKHVFEVLKTRPVIGEFRSGVNELATLPHTAHDRCPVGETLFVRVGSVENVNRVVEEGDDIAGDPVTVVGIFKPTVQMCPMATTKLRGLTHVNCSPAS